VLKFAPVAQEYGILTALSRRNNVFSRQDFFDVLKDITDLKYGYRDYDKLCGKFEQDKISALIERNVLHFRPVSDMARDLVPFPDYNVVTATVAPALRAIELIVAKRPA
jgi:hypothetical protein